MPSAPLDSPPSPPVFGVNEVRLDGRLWLITIGFFAAIALVVPRVWPTLEHFQPGADYRIPYSLSRDYWLYRERLAHLDDASSIAVVGDSVVWGEYVRPDGTLSHFLDLAAGATNRFVNAGVNGMFPLALEGLLRHYAQPLTGRRVILHFNPLWMTSPKADLSTTKPESFNHSRLVPQFSPRIPCYRADAAERLGAVFEHHGRFLQWVGHLENAYFDQKSIPGWTLADDGADPPKYPNAGKCPGSRITLELPSPFAPDPERGPGTPRHRSWNAAGTRTVDFEWVAAEKSLQWAAFQRGMETLRTSGASVFVVVGPFNEAMLSEPNRRPYRALRDEVTRWLEEHRVPHAVPEPLPAELYADASHPLTAGYELLANRLRLDDAFRAWSTGRPSP